MRFMIMHKNDPQTEAGQPPPPELVANMGAFIGEYAQSGRFVDGAGLSGSKHRTRLVFRGGRCTIKHGPYAGEHELPSSVLQLKVATREQAIGWAERYGKVLGDAELELGKVNEPWDIGLMPMPENPPLQFLLIDKADADTEANGRSAQKKAELTRLRTEMTKAGVLVKSVAPLRRNYSKDVKDLLPPSESRASHESRLAGLGRRARCYARSWICACRRRSACRTARWRRARR